jgi:hypothetical protein
LDTLDLARPTLPLPPGGWARKRCIHTGIPAPAPARTAGNAGIQGNILRTCVLKGISNPGQGSGAGRQRNPTSQLMVIKHITRLHRQPPRASLPNSPATSKTHQKTHHNTPSTPFGGCHCSGESPGGVAATLVASTPPRRHLCLTCRLLFHSGLIW